MSLTVSSIEFHFKVSSVVSFFGITFAKGPTWDSHIKKKLAAKSVKGIHLIWSLQKAFISFGVCVVQLGELIRKVSSSYIKPVSALNLTKATRPLGICLKPTTKKWKPFSPKHSVHGWRPLKALQFPPFLWKLMRCPFLSTRKYPN